jgi:hypothetical protein
MRREESLARALTASKPGGPVCPRGNNPQVSRPKMACVVDTDNKVGSLFPTAVPKGSAKPLLFTRWDNPLLDAWTAPCQRLPPKKAHRGRLRRF